jgi:hypothetical protein
MATDKLTFRQPSSHTAVSKTFILDGYSRVFVSDAALLGKWYDLSMTRPFKIKAMCSFNTSGNT